MIGISSGRTDISLSDRIDANSFTRGGLRTALEHDIEQLGSNMGALLKRTLANDPTGEMLHLIDQELGNGGPDEGGGPARQDGVWVSPDGSRALMLMRLRAAGLRYRWRATGAYGNPRRIHVSVTRLKRPGRPACHDWSAGLRGRGARPRSSRMQRDFPCWQACMVATALLLAYRSVRVLFLAFVPGRSAARSPASPPSGCCSAQCTA